MFGGGVGSVAGGAIGSIAGSALGIGFGGQILGSALGQALDQAAQAAGQFAQEATKASTLDRYACSKISGLAVLEQELRLLALQDSRNWKNCTLQAAQGSLEAIVGKEGVENLEKLAQSSEDASNA